MEEPPIMEVPEIMEVPHPPVMMEVPQTLPEIMEVPEISTETTKG